MIKLAASVMYVLSYVNGTHYSSTNHYDPCEKITSLELAMGCSTVDGRTMLPYNRLVAIAKFPNREFERILTKANTENPY